MLFIDQPMKRQRGDHRDDPLGHPHRGHRQSMMPRHIDPAALIEPARHALDFAILHRARDGGGGDAGILQFTGPHDIAWPEKRQQPIALRVFDRGHNPIL
jgi:hypothetical protein